MANFDMNEVRQLVDLHKVQFVTAIFQSDAPLKKYRHGVCRGVVEGYIAAYFDSRRFGPKFMTNYQEKLGGLRQNPSQFEALHGDYLKFQSNELSKIPCENTKQLKRSLAISLERAVGIWDQTERGIGLFFGLASKNFSAKGIFYIIFQNHCVLYVNDVAGYTFVDANTGEWHSPNVMDGFLADYFRMFYQGSHFHGPIKLSIYYPVPD